MLSFLRRKIFFLFSWLLCNGGLVWQLYYITMQYFAYESATSVQITFPLQIRPPKLILCVNKMYYNYTNDEIDDSTPMAWFDENTPAAERILSNFSFPQSMSFANSRLIKQKFFKQQFICYEFRIDAKVVLNQRDLSNSLNEPFFFEVTIDAFNGLFNEMFSAVQLFLHPANQSFYGPSKTFLTQELGSPDGNPTDGMANVVISYAHYEIRRLTSPFATDCLYYEAKGLESFDHCFDDCVIERSTQALGFYPYYSLIKKPISFPMLNVIDGENETITDQLIAIEVGCKKRCPQQDCLSNYFVPRRATASHAKFLKLTLSMSNFPSIISTYIPLINLIDFVTYLASTISFWLGLSPLGLLSGDLSYRFLCKLFKKRVTYEASCNSMPLHASFSGSLDSLRLQIAAIKLSEAACNDAAIRKLIGDIERHVN